MGGIDLKYLKILKIENEIMEISIANGLMYILKFNNHKCKLLNKKGAYLIEISEYIDYSSLVFPTFNIEDLHKNINSSYNLSETKKAFNTIFEIMKEKENMKALFKYYETLDEDVLNKEMKKKIKAVFLGTRTYGQGKTGLNKKNISPSSICQYERVPAMVGFSICSNYLRIDNIIEINMILVPKETDDIVKPAFKTFVDKETGEIKNLTKLSKCNYKTINLSELYLLSLMKMKEEFIINNYEDIFFITLKPTSNKPLADKLEILPVLNFSDDLLKKLYEIITWSVFDLDIKFALSNYLIFQDFYHFLDMINVFGKNKNFYLRENLIKELIDLQIDKVKSLYNNESIKKLGYGLKRLINDDKGFNIQVQLFNMTDIIESSKIISEINFLYFRKYKKCLLNDKELKDILSEINTTNDIKALSSVLITYSSIFIPNKKDNEEECEEEYEGEFE